MRWGFQLPLTQSLVEVWLYGSQEPQSSKHSHTQETNNSNPSHHLLSLAPPPIGFTCSIYFHLLTHLLNNPDMSISWGREVSPDSINDLREGVEARCNQGQNGVPGWFSR